VALRDEVDLLRLAVHGVVHGLEEPPMDVLERAVKRLADQAHTLVGEASVTGRDPQS
jgi:hypothetical protein